MSKIRWGIIGTGSIAGQFAKALQITEDAEIYAVCSRSMESADNFADKFNIPKRYVGLESFTSDKNIDIAYVATPHSLHCEGTLACLDAGIAVLCEKPFAMNSAEVNKMISKAREKNLFLMEAMWTYFFPAMFEVRRLISENAIGKVKLIQSSFCFDGNHNPEGRLLNPELGGGALLDVGVYNIALDQMIFGKEPETITSQTDIGKTGVDELSSIILKYDDGAMAVSNCAINVRVDHEAAIWGSDGYIKLPSNFWQPYQIKLKTKDHEEKVIDFEKTGNGYHYQAEEVIKCLREGKTECDIMSWNTSMAIMKTMDRIRKQWGLKYPMEFK